MVFLFAGNALTAQQQMPMLSPGEAAADLLKSLRPDQLDKMSRPWDDKERVNWDFVPKEYRAGVTVGSLSDGQKEKFYRLVLATGGEKTLDRVKSISFLESILRGVEGRKEGDAYRDPGKYFIQLFGATHLDKTWGWKIEGHHLCFNYVLEKNKVIAASPSVLGANPAIVLEGENKGYQLMKPEIQLATSILSSLNTGQKTKAIVSSQASKEILTYQQRKASIDKAGGVSFTELSPAQQTKLKELVELYIHRASRFFVKDMLARVEQAGWNKVFFVWEGSEDVSPGHTHYYRIQGPEFIIEYDNYQNNGNHVHSIFRDVRNDFGDLLAAHYKEEHP